MLRIADEYICYHRGIIAAMTKPITQVLGGLTDIDVRQLKIFAAIVESGGITQAEGRLDMANNTISTHLSKLEQRLDMRLCRRGRTGFALTAEGESVYRAAQELFDTMDAFRAQVQQLRAGLSGEIALAAPDVVLEGMQDILVPVFDRFLKALPGVCINISTAEPRVICDLVRNGSVDIAFNSAARDQAGLTSYTVGFEHVDLYCGPRNPLFGKQPGEAAHADYSEFKLMRSFGFYVPYNIVEKLKFSQVFVNSSLQDGKLLLLQASDYLAFMSENYAEKWVRSGKLAAVNSAEFRYKSDLVAYVSPTNNNEAVRTLTGILETELNRANVTGS